MGERTTIPGCCWRVARNFSAHCSRRKIQPDRRWLWRNFPPMARAANFLSAVLPRRSRANLRRRRDGTRRRFFRCRWSWRGRVNYSCSPFQKTIGQRIVSRVRIQISRVLLTVGLPPVRSRCLGFARPVVRLREKCRRRVGVAADGSRARLRGRRRDGGGTGATHGLDADESFARILALEVWLRFAGRKWKIHFADHQAGSYAWPAQWTEAGQSAKKS